MKFSKTSNKLFSYVIIIIILIISILTFFIISISMKNVYLRALNDMTNVAIHNIDEHIQMHKNEARLITEFKPFINMVASIEEKNENSNEYIQNRSQMFEYLSAKINSSSIEKIVITDKTNRIFLSNDIENINKIVPPNSPYWNNINPNISTAQIQVNEKNDYIVLISQPVRLYDKTVGYVFMELNFDMINSLMKNYKFGNSGNLFFITKESKFISYDKKAIPNSINEIFDYQNIFNIFEKNSHTSNIVYSSEFKNNSINSYMQYSYIPSLNAVIATSINKNEVNKTSLTTSFPLIFLLFVIFSLTIFYRYIVSKKILHPLNLLNRSLYMLKKGDLRARYNYNADNEFGNLSTVFNQTISNLQKTTLDLKEREAKSNIILNNITDVIWEFDIGANVIKMPENWSRLIESEYIQTNYLYTLESFVSYIHINYLSDFQQSLCDCIEKDIPMNLECQIKRFDNEYIWVKINGSCMYNIYEEPYKVIGSIFNISEIKNRENALREFAKRDDMTKLLKKVEMEQLVNEELRINSVGHSLLFIDLDDFKEINDNYGHLVGDEVIIHVSNILKEYCLSDCHICRFGGDEFVVFTRRIYTLCETEELAAKIIKELNNGYTIKDGVHINIKGSIGISRSPKDGISYAELMLKADCATYKVKNDVKNSYYIYGQNLI